MRYPSAFAEYKLIMGLVKLHKDVPGSYKWCNFQILHIKITTSQSQKSRFNIKGIQQKLQNIYESIIGLY